MTRLIRSKGAAVIGSVALLTAPAQSAIILFFQDPEGWHNAVGIGNATCIDFVFDTPQFLSTQYADLGILFTGGNDVATTGSPSSFEDGWGLKPFSGTPPLVEIAFTTPQHAFMIKFPGTVNFTLFSGGEAIHFQPGGATFGFTYVGVISTIAFDAVNLTSGGGVVTVDDLWFASVIPAPGGALLLLGSLPLLSGRKRRC